MSVDGHLPDTPSTSAGSRLAEPASEKLQVRSYREGTSGLTAMVSDADATAMGRAGFAVTERTWEGTTLTVTYQRLPSQAAGVDMRPGGAHSREAARPADNPLAALVRAAFR